MTYNTKKENKINIKVDIYNKLLLEIAARKNDMSLSSYILSTCIKQAKNDIQNNETITLDNVDRDFVMSLLSDTTQPNQNLKDIFS